MNNRISSLLTALVLGGILAGCGGPDTGAMADPTSEEVALEESDTPVEAQSNGLQSSCSTSAWPQPFQPMGLVVYSWHRLYLGQTPGAAPRFAPVYGKSSCTSTCKACGRMGTYTITSGTIAEICTCS